MPGDKPDVGFQYGVEGDQALLSTIKALRDELKNLQSQQERTATSAETMARAWRGLIELAGALKLAEFAREVFDTAVSLGKLQQITGVSTKTLSVYYKAATDVGVAHDQVDKGVIKLARSFVQLQAGNKAAAIGFGLLNLHAKDFVGLSPDEKLRKVTEAFAGLQTSGEKAAAAQALFSKGGAALIPVLNQLGREGFKEVSDQAERLGLIFSQDMVEGALRTKAAIADLTGVAEGATAQFEAGFLPALADTADALTKSISGQSVNGFKYLGEEAGKALKLILSLLGLVGIGVGTLAQTVVEWISFEFDSLATKVQTTWTVIKQLAKGDVSGAAESAKQAARDEELAQKDASDRISAVWMNAAKEEKEFYDNLWKPTARKLPKAGDKGAGDVAGGNLEKGLDRAEEAALKQKTQDELTLYKDLARQKNEADKREYEQGLISLEEYFNRRKTAITGEFIQELKALGSEKLALQGLLAKTEGTNAVTPQQEIQKQRDILDLKRQIAHVDAQIADETVKRDIEDDKNESERFRAKQDHLLKELEAEKKLADLEGARAKSVQLANQIEDLQLRKELEQLGRTKAQIDAFLAQYAGARDIRSKGAEAQKGFEGGEAGLSEKKSALQEKVASYQLEPYQAERQLRAEYEKEIPILEAKVQLLRQQAAIAQAAAEARGEKGPNAEAVDLTKQADQDETKLIKLRTEMTKMDTTWMSWRTEALSSIDQVSNRLTTGLNGWIQGHQRFGDAVKQMWNGIVMTGVTALEKLAAQWIAHHLKKLLVKVTTDQAEVASTATAAGEKDTIERTSGLKSVFRSAKIAAAKAWEALANIPYVGPILGAIAAAVVFAGVMTLGAFAEGGYVGRGARRTVAFAGGGQMIARSMLGGGLLRGPGSSTSDSIPAMLTDREYVVSAKGVESIGVDTLDRINSGALKGASLPQIRHAAPYSAHGFGAYAAGGLAIADTGAGGRGSGKSAPTIHMQNSFTPIDSKDFRDHIDDHLDYIADGIKDRMRNFRF